MLLVGESKFPAKTHFQVWYIDEEETPFESY